MRMLTALVLVMLAAGAAAAQHWFFPTVEIGRAALHTLEGPNPRYQASYLLDRYASEATCVLVLTDTQTGHFAITAVAPTSCLAREAAR